MGIRPQTRISSRYPTSISTWSLGVGVLEGLTSPSATDSSCDCSAGLPIDSGPSCAPRSARAPYEETHDGPMRVNHPQRNQMRGRGVLVPRTRSWDPPGRFSRGSPSTRPRASADPPARDGTLHARVLPYARARPRCRCSTYSAGGSCSGALTYAPSWQTKNSMGRCGS